MLGFGPFCLDLGHIAWIWAIWQNLGQNGPQRRRSPEGGAGEGGRTNGWMDGRTDGRTYGRTYGRTDSPCVLQDFVPFGAAALLPLNLNHTLLKQGTGTADHLLPLGCYFSFIVIRGVKLLSKYYHHVDGNSNDGQGHIGTTSRGPKGLEKRN